jgi:hypothetical protein
MTLSKVVKGRLAKPVRVLIYGVEGVGKSTFAAAAPNVIFVGAEDGTSELDVARYPEPRSWDEALEAIADLTTTQHDYKTLALDTLDWLEPLCWEHVCRGKKGKDGKLIQNIEDFGYGKGYNAALDQWRLMLAALERLRNARGMHIVLIAHSTIKDFKNPVGDDFDRYQLKLHQKASGLMREWCDAILFAQHETFTHEKDGRVRGIQSGARIVCTERSAAWDAKNRYDLPDKLPLDWDSFWEAVQAHRPADPAKLRAGIASLLEQTNDEELIERVQVSLTMVGDDAAQLARIYAKLTATISLQTDNASEESE